MIESLLPAEVAAVDTTLDRIDVTLFPGEEAQIARAVETRRREYTTARWCARRAMAALGQEAVPVLPGLRGAPQWAPGLVGSITHCAGYRGAALARADEIAALGIDAEPNQPLPEGILESIALPQERSWVHRLLRTLPQVRWDRLLFSMKESVYKSYFPLTGHTLEFEDALLTVDAERGTFRAALLNDPAARPGSARRVLTGRFSATHGVILSAIAVPAVRHAELAHTTAGAPLSV
ncbi:4'-phosphopantetheinyl transferase superfamily protein [Streptomyces sp. NPDC005209]|uniref:4'-phosphopantetheinyl transferase family protein n=1 Tax=Streptomyces sp. NPDC005209 TaxID=3156715 RepID=UPI0033AA01E3